MGAQADTAEWIPDDRPQPSRRRGLQRQRAADLLSGRTPGAHGGAKPAPHRRLRRRARGPETHFYYPLLLLAWCCSGVVAVCAYRIAARASGREWLGLWTGVVFACYLSEMFITTTYSMASEPLFAACLAVYVLLLIRAADRPGLGIALAAGVMLGLTALSRPTVLWLPAVSVAWLLFELRGRGFAFRERGLMLRERGLIMSAAFVVAFAAVQVPWVVRNYRVFGDPIVTTTLGGFNVYRHNGMIEEGKYHTGYSHPEMERRIRRLAEAAGPSPRIVQRGRAQYAAEGRRSTDYPDLSVAVREAVGDADGVDLVQREFRPRALRRSELPHLPVRAGRLLLCRAFAGAGVLPAPRAYRVLRRVPQRDQRAYRFICPIMPYMILLAGLPVYAWWQKRERRLQPDFAPSAPGRVRT